MHASCRFCRKYGAIDTNGIYAYIHICVYVCMYMNKCAFLRSEKSPTFC